jgi:hypothetical protein
MKLEKLLYQIKNWKAHWRAFYLGSYIVIEGAIARAIGNADRVLMFGTLDARVVRRDGSVLDLGCIGKRVVTTAGVNYLRDEFAASAGDIGNFKYHGCGTGVAAEAIGDVALGAECTAALNPDSTRGVGTQVNGVAKIYSSVATLSFDAVAAVTEHGLFSAAAAGTLWDRTVFAAVNVGPGESIQFTYNLTIADGG